MVALVVISTDICIVHWQTRTVTNIRHDIEVGELVAGVLEVGEIRGKEREGEGVPAINAAPCALRPTSFP